MTRTTTVLHLFSSPESEIRHVTVTPDRLARLLEDAPVGALARLTLTHAAARHEAAQTVARFLCEGLERADAGEGQFALPL